MGKPKIKFQRSQRKQRFSPRKITCRQDDVVNITIHSLREREDCSKGHSGESSQPHKCQPGRRSTVTEHKDHHGQQRCNTSIKGKLHTSASSLTSAQSSSSRTFNDTYEAYVHKLRHLRPGKSAASSPVSSSSGSDCKRSACVSFMTSDAVSGKRSSDDRDVDGEKQESLPSGAVLNMETNLVSTTNRQHRKCRTLSKRTKHCKTKSVSSTKAQHKKSFKRSKTNSKILKEKMKCSESDQELPDISTMSETYSKNTAKPKESLHVSTDQSIQRHPQLDVSSHYSSNRVLIASTPHQGHDGVDGLPENDISAREPARILRNRGRVPVADAGVQVYLDNMSADFQVCVDVESNTRFFVENGVTEVSSAKDLGGCKNSHLSDLVISELEKQKRNDFEKDRQSSTSRYVSSVSHASRSNNYISDAGQRSENMSTDRLTESAENIDSDRTSKGWRENMSINERPTGSRENMDVNKRRTVSGEHVSTVGSDLDSFVYSSSHLGTDIGAVDQHASKLTMPALDSSISEEKPIQTRLKPRSKRRSSVTDIDHDCLNQQLLTRKPATDSVTECSKFQVPSVSKRRKPSEKPGTSTLKLRPEILQNPAVFQASCDNDEKRSHSLESRYCSSLAAQVDENMSQAESSSSCNSNQELTSQGKRDIPGLITKELLTTKCSSEKCSASVGEVVEPETDSPSSQSVVPLLVSPSTSTQPEGVTSGPTELTGSNSPQNSEGLLQSVRKKQMVKIQKAWRKSKSVFNPCKLSDQLDECFSWSENSSDVSLASCNTVRLNTNTPTIEGNATESETDQNNSDRCCSEDELLLAETHLRNLESHEMRPELQPVLDSTMIKNVDEDGTMVICQDSFECKWKDQRSQEKGQNAKDHMEDHNADEIISDIDLLPFNILDDTSDRMIIDSVARGDDDRCALPEEMTNKMSKPSFSSPITAVSPKKPTMNSNTATHMGVVQYSSSSSEEEGGWHLKAKNTKKRGHSGWEDSLRQHPAKTQLFQVGENTAKTAGVVSQSRLEKEKGNSSDSDLQTKELVEVTETRQDKRTDDLSINQKPRSELKQADGKEAVRKERTPPKKRHNNSKGNSQDLPSKKCNDSPKNKGPEAVVLETDEELAKVVEVEPNYGKLVWARLCGERWWPGIVVKGTLIYLQSQKSASSWVYWFGDHKVSQVSHDKIIPFSMNYMAKVGNFKSKMYRKAVLEALAECCRRGGPHANNYNDSQMLQWAEADFPDSTTGRQVSLEPPQDCPLPGSVMDYLTDIGKAIRKKVASMDAGNKQPDENRDNAVDAVRNGQKQLEDICISCSDLHQEVVLPHPLFEGGLCSGCKAEVSETMYAVGEDGLHSFCAVCGAGGDLFVCDSPECQRVYCRPCVEELGGEDMLQKVIAASRWHCFLCSSCTDQPNCLLRPRPNSHEMIIRFFDTGYRVQMPSLAYFSSKRPLRVLSLFDGIGSGKLTLDQLGFSVDAYYASEIDADAIIVTRCNHGNSVVHVGDVMQLDHKKLAELSPIDLLIGGSPCNDVSLANPARRGFQSGSTALLFFEYVRVRDKLQQLNSNTHLFWLFENVASMKTEFKNTMSRFLECQPALWDSKYMSAQRRGRFFWGNIPGMYSTPAISTFMHENVDLNSVLEQNCNRRATISKMGCVTTRTNSLKHGKNDELFPVEMEGETTGIWISEVERLFGFPPHYTDVGNMPATRRQKLLGKSFSIPIIRNLLTPLKQYFTTTTTSTAE